MNKAIPFLLAIPVAGCGAGFEPSAEIDSLRVLGVQKDQPYAHPGSAVTLRMLWYDGEVPDGTREIQRFWSPPCTNPAGDLYYTCFARFLGAETALAGGGSPGGAAGGAPTSLPSEIALPNMGDQTTVAIPPDIISSRPPPAGGQVPYGLTYVFFGVCAGQMYLKLDLAAGFPLVCKDASGQYLGADDFVVGYTSIYSYDSVSNANPAINGIAMDGQLRQTAEEGVCIGAACTLPQLHPTDQEGQTMVRIPACADDGAEQCPAHRIRGGDPGLLHGSHGRPDVRGPALRRAGQLGGPPGQYAARADVGPLLRGAGQHPVRGAPAQRRAQGLERRLRRQMAGSEREGSDVHLGRGPG